MRAVARPERRRDAVARSDLIPDAVITAGALVLSGVTAHRWWSLDHPARSAGAAGVGVAAFAAQSWKIWRAYRRAAREDPEPELTRALLMLHTLLTRGTNSADDPTAVRLCLFVPHRRFPERVVRLTDYVGPDGPAAAARSTPCGRGWSGRRS